MVLRGNVCARGVAKLQGCARYVRGPLCKAPRVKPFYGVPIRRCLHRGSKAQGWPSQQYLDWRRLVSGSFLAPSRFWGARARINDVCPAREVRAAGEVAIAGSYGGA
eukprot:10279201-Lingulodinium_polyedra.AAC.1